jgi:hypothetical protein
MSFERHFRSITANKTSSGVVGSFASIQNLPAQPQVRANSQIHNRSNPMLPNP